jgi:hypothetical protein
MQLSLFPEDEKKISKYQAIDDKYFGFGLFEDVLEVINERAYTNDDHMFKAGVASCEAAVRRLREDYYESIKKMYNDQENINQI